ncbi:hypothetical protein BE17_07200 [Sorangium cellulosum]|uniref:Uncharacterized protein n=1 Tax=Sorangium cellulosum TaxID=56 RepID=A0A150SMV7_SORCE|nr:hypothetical protein BE17_07200 [Sorangium cellulosum]
MIELTFKLAPDGGEPRDVVVRIHEPTRNPPEKQWPWAVTVDIDGRPSTTYGVDPLDAVENGAQHAAIVLRGGHGDALDPPIEPRMKAGQ